MAICRNTSRGRDMATRARRADGFWQRAVGLLGRRTLARDEALFIPRCSSVHTCFMRFSIDVAFVDCEGRVVKIVPDVRPFRFVFGVRGASAVWEMAAGTMEAALEVGEKINLVQTYS